MRQPLYMLFTIVVRPFDPGMPAGRPARVEDHRPRPFLLQCCVDVPDQLFADFRIGLTRLPVEQILEFGDCSIR